MILNSWLNPRYPALQSWHGTFARPGVSGGPQGDGTHTVSTPATSAKHDFVFAREGSARSPIPIRAAFLQILHSCAQRKTGYCLDQARGGLDATHFLPLYSPVSHGSDTVEKYRMYVCVNQSIP